MRVQNQREVTLAGFRSGKFPVLVATDVAARGLDITGVELVVQCEPPKDPETYIHRSAARVIPFPFRDTVMQGTLCVVHQRSLGLGGSGDKRQLLTLSAGIHISCYDSERPKHGVHEQPLLQMLSSAKLLT